MNATRKYIMRKADSDRLDALRNAVPWLLRALGVEVEANKITAGLSAGGELPRIIINISDDKTLRIESKFVAKLGPDDIYRTLYTRCYTRPREEYINVKHISK